MLWRAVGWLLLDVAETIQGRLPRQAKTIYRFVAKVGEGSSSTLLQRMQATAAVREAAMLGLLDAELSLAANDRIIRRFGSSADEDVRIDVAWAMVNKAVDLDSLQRSAEARAAYQELMTYAPFEGRYLPPLAQAMINEAIAMGNLGRDAEEVALYDRITDALTSSSDAQSQLFLAGALVNKAIVLVTNRYDFESAITLCDAALSRFWNADDWKTSDQLKDTLAGALRWRAVALAALDHYPEAIADVDRLVERYLGAGHPGVEGEVAWAMLLKGAALERLDRKQDALGTYSSLVSRYRRSRGEIVKSAVRSAMRAQESLET